MLSAVDEAAQFQLTENSGNGLSAAVQPLLGLLNGKVQSDGAVRLNVAVLPGNAGPIQKHGIQHLGVIGDVVKVFILQEKSRQRDVASCWTMDRELTKIFYRISIPSILSKTSID